MKLLYVIPYPKFFTQHKSVGGHIAHCMGIINAFLKKRFKIRYFSEEKDPLLNNFDIETYTYPNKYKSFLGRQLWFPGFFLKLKQHVKLFKPDVVYMRYSVSASFWYWAIKKALDNTPLILEVNSIGFQRIKYLSFFDRKFLKTANVVVTISTELGCKIQQKLGVEVIVVPNGIDKDRIPEKLIRTREDKKPRSFTMTYAGLLKPGYGIEFLIDATEEIIDEVPGLKMIFYGDGPLYEKLKNMENGRRWLNVAGPIPFDRIVDRLLDADVLLYPTGEFYRFQSPTKLFEYMAAARPIVAAKTEQTEIILKGGELGYLFGINNKEEYKKRILTVYNTRDIAHKKALAARREALGKHSWDSRVDLILERLGDDK